MNKKEREKGTLIIYNNNKQCTGRLYFMMNNNLYKEKEKKVIKY